MYSLPQAIDFVYSHLSTEIASRISNFYHSSQNSYIVEFENRITDSIFHIEVTASKFGYFAEVFGKTVDYCECLELSECHILNDKILNFLNDSRLNSI